MYIKHKHTICGQRLHKTDKDISNPERLEQLLDAVLDAPDLQSFSDQL